VTLQDWALELIERIRPLAELLDSEHNIQGVHVESLEAQKAKVLDPSLTPSHKVLEAVRELGSFAKFGLQQSALHAQAFRAEPLMPAEVAAFDETAQASLADQREIEQVDTGSFDDFVAAYNSSTLCGNC
jgi:glutamate--cysteine ligase